MVVGLVLVSTLVALLSAAVAALAGSGWLAALGVYLAAGMTTSLLLVLRLILCEMATPRAADLAPAPATITR